MPKRRGTVHNTQKFKKTIKKRKRFLSNLESAASIVSNSNVKIKLLHSIAYVNLSKDTFDPDNYEAIAYSSTPTKSPNKAPDGLLAIPEPPVRRSLRKQDEIIDITTDDHHISEKTVAEKGTSNNKSGRAVRRSKSCEAAVNRAEDGLADSVQHETRSKKLERITTHVEKTTRITRSRSWGKIDDKQNLTQVTLSSSTASSTFSLIKSPRNQKYEIETPKPQANRTNNVGSKRSEMEREKNKREKNADKQTSSNVSDIKISLKSRKNKIQTTPTSAIKKTFNAASGSVGSPVENESDSENGSKMEVDEVKSKKNNKSQTLRRSKSITRKLNEAVSGTIVLSSDSDAYEEECEAVVHAKLSMRKIRNESAETLMKTAAKETKRELGRRFNVQSPDEDLSSSPDKENGSDASIDYMDSELSGTKDAIPQDQVDKKMEETDNNENDDDVPADHMQTEPTNQPKSKEKLDTALPVVSEVTSTDEMPQEQQENEQNKEQLMDVEDIENFINKTINDNDDDSTEAVDGDTTLSTQELIDVLGGGDGSLADVSVVSAASTVTSVEKLEASKKVAAEARKLIKEIADYATDSDSQSGRKVTSESGSDVEVTTAKKKRPSFKLRFSKGFDYSKYDKHSCDICNMVFRTKCNLEAHLLKHYDARDLTVRVFRVILPSKYDTSKHNMDKYLHPKKKKPVTPMNVDDVKSLLTKYCKDDTILEPFDSIIEGDISFSQSTTDPKSEAASNDVDDGPNITILSDHTVVSGDKPEHVVEIDVDTFKAVASPAAVPREEEKPEGGQQVEGSPVVEDISQESEIIELNSNQNDLVSEITDTSGPEVPENDENDVEVATEGVKVIEDKEKDQDANEDELVVIPDDENKDGKEYDVEIVPETEEMLESTQEVEKTEENDTEEAFVSPVEAVKGISNVDQQTAKKDQVIANTSKEAENITSDDPISADPDLTQKRKHSTDDDEHIDKKQKLASNDEILNTSHNSITSDDFQSCIDITAPTTDNVSLQLETDAVPEIELRDGTVSRCSDASENENPEYLAKLAKLDKQLQAIIETHGTPTKACDDLDSTMTMNDLSNLPESDVTSEKIDESPIAP